MPGLQRADLGGDAKQLSDKILDMRGQIDNQIRVLFARQRLRMRARFHEAVEQGDVGGFEMLDKGGVQPHQAFPAVQLFKLKACWEAELIGHSIHLMCCGGKRYPRASNKKFSYV